MPAYKLPYTPKRKLSTAAKEIKSSLDRQTALRNIKDTYNSFKNTLLVTEGEIDFQTEVFDSQLMAKLPLDVEFEYDFSVTPDNRIELHYDYDVESFEGNLRNDSTRALEDIYEVGYIDDQGKIVETVGNVPEFVYGIVSDLSFWLHLR